MSDPNNMFTIRKQKAHLNLTYLVRAFKLIWKAGPFLTLALFCLNALMAAIPALLLFITRDTVDQIIRLISAATPGVNPEILRLLGLLGGLWCLQLIVSMLSDGVNTILQHRVSQQAQLSVMQKCAQLDIAFFENPVNLNTLENASMGSAGYIYTVIITLVSFVRNLSGTLFFLGILLRLHWAAVLVIVITGLPQLWANGYFAKKRWDIETSLAEPRRMQLMLNMLVTQRDPAKEIKLFSLYQTIINRFREFAQQFIRIEVGFIKKRAGLGILLGLAPVLGAVVVWYMIVRSAIAHSISIGDIVLYTGAVASFQNGLLQFFSIGSQIFRTVLYLGNYYKLMDTQPGIITGALKVSPTAATSEPLAAPLVLEKGIEFRNVSFAYPGSPGTVLKNLNFTLAPRGSVAIVGRNGAGKTTLIKLLVRLYDPTEGEICLEGRPLPEYNLKQLYNSFGVIFQDYIRYPLTARENIAFGCINRLDEPGAVETAARNAGAHDFLAELPLKYETPLGRQFMGSGVDLSLGQWQKVSLARALMRRESPILILDEPTASMDVFAEENVYRKFTEMMQDRLSIIISHRFSTVKGADHILVLERGELVEAGNHTELMAAGGLYREMFTTQANRFR